MQGERVGDENPQLGKQTYILTANGERVQRTGDWSLEMGITMCIGRQWEHLLALQATIDALSRPFGDLMVYSPGKIRQPASPV